MIKLNNESFKPLDEDEKDDMNYIDSGALKPLKAISLRVDPKDLSAIKVMAKKMGLPYQTWIKSILHQVITGNLVSKGP